MLSQSTDSVNLSSSRGGELLILSECMLNKIIDPLHELGAINERVSVTLCHLYAGIALLFPRINRVCEMPSSQDLLLITRYIKPPTYRHVEENTGDISSSILNGREYGPPIIIHTTDRGSITIFDLVDRLSKVEATPSAVDL
jgi:hypothetical protein